MCDTVPQVTIHITLEIHVFPTDALHLLIKLKLLMEQTNTK